MFQKVQNKIIVLMSVIALAMMVGLYLMDKSDEEKIILLLSNQRKEKEVLLNKIIEFKSKSVDNFVYDYTYWDDMVDFVKSGDEAWAKENIEVSIPTFNIDVAWVYKTDLSFMYSTSRTDAEHLKKLPLSKDVLEKIVSKGAFFHFFMMTDAEVLEIFGASIHPTFDEERKTPPQGYLFVGCLWTDSYLQELSRLLGTDISLARPETEQSSIRREDLKNFIIKNTKPLYGWDGTHIINVHSTSQALIAKTLNERSNTRYLVSIAYSIVLLVFLSVILFRSINRPLNMLSRSLANGNPDLIKGLASQKNEFGNLAIMISEFFDQKNLLMKEISEHSRAEEVLRESERQLSTVYDTVGDVIFHLAVEDEEKYRFFSINQAFCSYTGLSQEQIIGKMVNEVITEPALTMALSKYRQAIDEKRVIRWEGTIDYPAGRLTGEVSIAPVFNNKGRCTSLVGSVHDITERKRAEDALRESEERFRGIYENSTIGMYRTTPDGHILLCNPTLIHMLGYEFFDELAKRNLEEEGYEPGYERTKFLQILRSEGEVHGFESGWIRKDGSTVFVRESAKAISDEDGKVLYYEGTVEDITKLMQAEKALRESEKNYRELIDGMNETVWVIDFNGNLIDVNKTTIEVLGYSKEEILTIGLYGIDASLKKEDIKALANAMPSDKLQIFETSHKTKDGRTFPVEVYSSLVMYQGKKAILSIARDITERKQAEEALRSANKRLRVLHQITETVHESLELGVIFKRITDAVVKSMGFSTALVLTLDENGENFRVRSLSSSKLILTGINKILGFPIKKLAVHVSEIVENAKNAATTGDILIGKHLSDIAHPPLEKSVCNALEKLGGNKSYILVPMVFEKKIIGGMIVSSAKEQVLKADIDMLSTFASTAVQAIANADLLVKTNMAKEQIHKNLKEKEILLRELYHRTKNNMQVISSMLRMEARSIKERQISEVFKEIESKIMSMALVHQKLYESKDLSHLNLKDYFNSLITHIKQSYVESLKNVSINTEIEDINILIDTAIPLGLIFNELISNATKHAFPDKARGEIKVRLYLTSKNELVLEVSDNGPGLPKGFDIQKDIRLGLETVIDLVKYQLNGQIRFYNKKGLHCKITLKEELYEQRI